MKFAFLLSGLVLLAAAPAIADGLKLTPIQYDRRDNGGFNRDRRDNGAQNAFPGGSWQATCRRPQMNGSELTAECQDARGRYRLSSVDTRTCANFNLANRDGGLVCEGRGGGFPGGSWQATCRRPDQRGSRLLAECQDARGRWRQTTIDLSTCSANRVANRDGGLVCE
jgi:hypothetical protein